MFYKDIITGFLEFVLYEMKNKGVKIDKIYQYLSRIG